MILIPAETILATDYNEPIADSGQSVGDFLEARIRDLLAESQRLRTKAKRLRAALEPFSDVAGEGSDDFPDETPVVVTFGRSTHYALKLGDFRRAAEASAA